MNKRLGVAARKVQDYPRAVRFYEKALNFDPDDYDSWISLSDLMLETKAFAEVRNPERN